MKLFDFDRVAAERAAQNFHVVNAAIEDVHVDAGAFDHVITDPPYAARTQDNTRRGRKTKAQISEPMPLGFNPLSIERRARWAQWIANATRRWAIVFSDHESSVGWAEDLERAGLVYVRTAIWLRRGGAPQFTGDRPASGHECIVLAHRGKGMRWNGRGKFGVYEERIVTGEKRAHATQKPLSLMLDLVRDFCDPGEVIMDPFAGSGTTLVAAKLHGVFCAGVELDEKFASYAVRRAAAVAMSTQATAESV